MSKKATILLLDFAAVRALWRPRVLWVAVASLAFNLASRFFAAGLVLFYRGAKVGSVTDILVHGATSEDAARGIILGTEARADAVFNQLIVLGSSNAGHRDQQQSKRGNCDTHGELQISGKATKGGFV